MTIKTTIINAMPILSERTFILSKYDNDKKLYARYRTYPVCSIEFKEMQYYTSKDWQHFLNTSDNYRVIK